jgi:hypothetical protein
MLWLVIITLLLPVFYTFTLLLRSMLRPSHVHQFGPWSITGEWEKRGTRPPRTVGKVMEQRRTCKDDTCKWTEVRKQEWSLESIWK